jgi:hypothetical protein
MIPQSVSESVAGTGVASLTSILRQAERRKIVAHKRSASVVRTSFFVSKSSAENSACASQNLS